MKLSKKAAIFAAALFSLGGAAYTYNQYGTQDNSMTLANVEALAEAQEYGKYEFQEGSLWIYGGSVPDPTKEKCQGVKNGRPANGVIITCKIDDNLRSFCVPGECGNLIPM